MAQCKLTPHEFIQNAFSPMVAVMCSPLVDQTCQKNNLSFTEMVQPFCKLNTEAHFKDPSGNIIPVRNLRITILDVNSRPPQPTLARKFLNESVSSVVNERNYSLQVGDQTVDIPASVPWFEAWRETFLQVQFPSDHEFTKHFIGCLLVVSSAENNPADTLLHMGQQLQQLQNVTPAKLPKWFCHGVLKYCVLLHDAADGNNDKVESIFETMKSTYGSNHCFLLQINSRPPGQVDEASHLPDPWSQFLIRQLDSQDSSDHDSSPRTPAEVGGVTGMPNRVSADGDSVETLKSTVLEVAQEAGESSPVPVTHHPLSPETDAQNFFINSTDKSLHNSLQTDSNSATSHINSNVWAGQTNQVNPESLVHHGGCLNANDLERLRTLVQEFCVKALLPFVERQIQQLSDIISNKKGVSRSLFSATKRWFGSNKPGLPGMNTAVNAVVYNNEAAELQVRRLGDLCFMFGHYTLAFQAYHSAKRDFSADQAWLYYAGALEMAALSAFMQGEPTRKAQDYMEESIVTYLNSCKMPQFATRATLLSTECLKGRSLYGEAAKQFIRMTSEDSDLRSALLLEQASYCFLKSTRPRMMRKYAFHIVLAGHRFSKAGQRIHALRCYRQAYQIYENKNWSLAEDHIHFTIGRQAANLKQTSEAAVAFSKLLTPSSRQSATQQAAFLREYVTIQQQLLAEEHGQMANVLPVLPLPLVDNETVKVLTGYIGSPVVDDEIATVVQATGVTFNDDPDNVKKWSKLEEVLVSEAQGSLPLLFKPTTQLFSNQTVNKNMPTGVVDEPVHVSVVLQNPLQIPIPLLNVHLLWSFQQPGDDSVISNETSGLIRDKLVDTQRVETVLLKPNSSQEVILSVTPHSVGELRISGIAYHLSNPPMYSVPEAGTNHLPSTISIPGKQVFNIRCPRAKFTKERINQDMKDRRLEINVVPSAPCLQVKFLNLSLEMLCGEMQHVEVEFSNIGNAALGSLHLASSTPYLFSIGSSSSEMKHRKETEVIKIPLPNNILHQGQTHTVPMWIRAPDKMGTTCLEMLFYYENKIEKSVPKYRLVRHSWQISTLGSIQVSCTAVRSKTSSENKTEQVLNLITKLKNVNQVHDPIMTEISLLQISIISPVWQLSTKIPLQKGIKLQAEEIVHLIFNAVRLQNEDSKDSKFSDLIIEDCEDSRERLQSASASPYLDFYLHHISSSILSENVDSFRETQHSIFQNSDKNGSASKALENSLSIDATIILRWKAYITNGRGKKRVALGQHHLGLKNVNMTVICPAEPQNVVLLTKTEGPVQIFGPDAQLSRQVSSNNYPSLETLQKLVMYSVHHPSHIVHDFCSQRLCLVPVKLQLQNCSDTHLVIKVNALGNNNTSSATKNKLYTPHSSATFRWLGLSVAHLELDSRSNDTVSLTAAMGAPGIFDLGTGLEVWCRTPDAPEADFVEQMWQIESALVIESTPK